MDQNTNPGAGARARLRDLATLKAMSMYRSNRSRPLLLAITALSLQVSQVGACTPTTEAVVSMRPVQTAAVAHQGAKPLTSEAVAIASGLLDGVGSTIFCGVDNPDCHCSLDDVYLAQIFLKSDSDGDNAIGAALLRDEVALPPEVYGFTSDTNIGVDIYYNSAVPNFDPEGWTTSETRTIEGVEYRYVRMQDVPLFNEEYPFTGDGLVETLAGSASYTFAIGASADAPGISPVGCYLTLALDFEALP